MKRPRVGLGLFLFAACAAFSAPPASASGSDTSKDGSLSAVLTGDALAHYEAARSLFAAGDTAGALVRFERAYALSSDARLLWNVAACEAKLHHYARAMTLVDRYVATSGALLTDRDREQAARFRAAARPHVAVVDVSRLEPGIAIAVDDEAIGATPLPGAVYLEPGAHRVHFTKAGRRGLIRAETVSAGAELTWTVSLERLRVRVIED